MSSNTCPFCQQNNQCAVNEITEINPCWCQIKHVPQALISLLPAETKNKQCICLSCIESYQKNPFSFKETYFGKTK
jgi:hypothetical protein